MHMSEVSICYGMTETSPVSTQTRVDDPLELRVTTVGQVGPHLEIKIVAPGTGGETLGGRNETGELCTRGYSVMTGYWNDPPEKTAEPSTPTAGCTPATSPRWTTPGTSASPAGSRTW